MENLKSVLQEKGMTYEGLSNLTGIPANTIKGYANNQQNPSFERLLIIGNALNVSISYLLGDKNYINKELMCEKLQKIIKALRVLEKNLRESK